MRHEVDRTLEATEQAIRDARRAARSGSEDVSRHLARVLNGVALALDDLGLDEPAGKVADAGARLEGWTPNAGELDEHAAEELLLYLQNDSRFWGPRSQGEAIERRYAQLWRKGQFDRERAIDGYMHVLKTAAQQYVKEMGSPGDRWYTMFTVPTRRAAAAELADQFIAEAELGNFRG